MIVYVVIAEAADYGEPTDIIKVFSMREKAEAFKDLNTRADMPFGEKDIYSGDHGFQRLVIYEFKLDE